MLLTERECEIITEACTNFWDTCYAKGEKTWALLEAASAISAIDTVITIARAREKEKRD